jgi:hypothetical protein
MSLVDESYRFATTDKEKTGSPQGGRLFPPSVARFLFSVLPLAEGESTPSVCTNVPINMSTDSDIAMLGFDFATEPLVTAP